MRAKQTYDRLLPIISQINKAVVCQSMINNGNGTYTFLCKNTKWLTAGYDITIASNVYTITSFVCNVSVTVSGSIVPNILSFDLYTPFFKHGTIQKVGLELSQTVSYKDKLPLIFLHEIIEEKLHFDPLDIVDTDADVRLYFLTDCDYKNWNQLQGDTLGVKPMRNLCNEFLLALSVSQYVSDLTGIGNVKNYNVFGNYNDNGTTKNIFNEYLSGVQLKISIPFLKESECSTVPLLDNRPAPGYVYDLAGSLLAVLYSNEAYIAGTPCSPVLIKDNVTGALIATIASGGQYLVEQLTTVTDTIDSNTTTIIDPLT